MGLLHTFFTCFFSSPPATPENQLWDYALYYTPTDSDEGNLQGRPLHLTFLVHYSGQACTGSVDVKQKQMSKQHLQNVGRAQV